MNQLTTKELERIISLYLDGELEPEESRHLLVYLDEHPSAAKDFEIMRMAKKQLRLQKHLPINDWFWLKLSNKIEGQSTREKKFFSFHRPVLALGSLTVLVILVMGSIYIKDASLFNKFFIEKKELVANTFMKGNILPLFTNLNKDQVLNFALFGNLQIDSADNTELQVKADRGQGSQVEILKRTAGEVAPIVSVSDFCRQLGVSKSQEFVVDSILGSYKQKLQAAVLVSENKEIAIHEELADLNRAMVSTIASSLEPVQRSRFQQFLTSRNAPYSVIALNAPSVEPKILLQKIPRISRNNRYVVVSKDTVGIAEVRMNIDSIREYAHKNAIQFQRLAMAKMFGDLAELQRGFDRNLVISGANASRVKVSSGDNAFQINFESPEPVGNSAEAVDMVEPRSRIPLSGSSVNGFQVIGDSIFTIEMNTNPTMTRILKKLPSGEFRVEYIDTGKNARRMKLLFRSNSPKNKLEKQLQKQKINNDKLIDLDSLLIESKTKSLEAGPSLKKGSKKMYEF
jgi:hypothetical protein